MHHAPISTHNSAEHHATVLTEHFNRIFNTAAFIQEILNIIHSV